MRREAVRQDHAVIGICRFRTGVGASCAGMGMFFAGLTALQRAEMVSQIFQCWFCIGKLFFHKFYEFFQLSGNTVRQLFLLHFHF
ncbi:MAG: hypothetical protein ACLTXT_04505 [Ruminococcus callidus]